jgi:hypothetical protein
VLTVDLARRLRAAGLSWTPVRGDHFVLPGRGMDDEVFVISDMTVEVHRFPTATVIGFNGTTEWALDSVEQSDALWIPLEHQLRDLLGGLFQALRRDTDAWAVVLTLPGGDAAGNGAGPSRREHVVRGGSPVLAYGAALVEVLEEVGAGLP